MTRTIERYQRIAPFSQRLVHVYDNLRMAVKAYR